MELNVLLRGQSNAFLLGEYNGGAQAMAAKVEALLGFDGITDKVTLEYSSSSDTGNTAFPGTSFLKEWLNGSAATGWTVGELEQSLLDFIAHVPAAQKAEPTAVVWLHSEYDSGNASLTPAEFASAVRFDAALVRQAFGQSAASLPYLFVSAIPYSEGTGAGHQAIRAAMEELAADPAFNAHIAARALDTDMNWQDVTGDGKVDYGGPHQSDSDGLQTGDRLAFALAQNWAQYAKPGSPVALENGLVDDLGPQVVQASVTGTNQVAVTVAFDAAHSLAALDAGAAAGLGWTVIGSGGVATAVDATAARITGTDSLLLTFAGPLPAGGLLYYGYGYGRLAATDGTGQGHAVYDDEGMPIWVDAHGLAVGGLGGSVATPPVNTGTGLPAAQFGSDADGWTHSAQVWSGTLTFGGVAYQTFGGRSDWGDLAGVSLAPAAWDPSWSTHLAFDNIPDVALDLHAVGTAPLDLLLVSVRGGTLVLGDGSDQVTWVAQAEAGSSGHVLEIWTGAGNDVLHVTAAGLSGLADYDRADNGAAYDANYQGGASRAEVHLGSGAVTVTAEGQASLLVYGGGGSVTLQGGAGQDTALVGSGGGTYAGGAGADNWVFIPGSGHAVIQDFASGEDQLNFFGIAAADLGITQATEGGVGGLSIVFGGDGHSVFLAGVAALGPQDIVLH